MMRYQDVRDNVQAFLAGSGAGKDWTATQLEIQLAHELGIQFVSEKHVGLVGEGKTFDGQVRRALRELAALGVLVVSKSNGSYARRKGELVYENAATWAARTAARDARAAEDRQDRRTTEKRLATLAACVSQLNEIVGELAAEAAKDPEFAGLVDRQLAKANWALGFPWKGERGDPDLLLDGPPEDPDALRKYGATALRRGDAYKLISYAGGHRHDFMGQALIHNHEGGTEPHGYFEHKEDRR